MRSAEPAASRAAGLTDTRRPSRGRRSEQRWSRASPSIGLTGGMGAGKSTALAALERLGAAVHSSDAVVHELYEGAELRDAVVGALGPRRSRRAARSTAGGRRRAFADRRGARMAGGACLAAGRRARWRSLAGAGARARRRRARSSSRCRCCSRRGWRGLRRDDRGRRRRAVRASGVPRPAGTRSLASAPRASSPRRRRRGGRRSSCERRHVEELERELSDVLDKLGEMSSGRVRRAVGRVVGSGAA